jgi:hypothetical protein
VKNWDSYKHIDTTLVQFQIDSVLCFNTAGNKMITTRIGRGLGKDNVMDAVTHYYGVKINSNWYFFSGPTMHVPREYYQKDIHTSLSFEKLKQIATAEIYRGYLKKEEMDNGKLMRISFKI